MHQERFISYLSSEKRFSVHTITSYSVDIRQFSLFLADEYQIKTEISEVSFQIIRSWIGCIVLIFVEFAIFHLHVSLSQITKSGFESLICSTRFFFIEFDI